MGPLGSNNETYDFGFKPAPAPVAYLGNYVWNDENHNGEQEITEVGVSGVTVSLLNATNNAILSSTVTDAYGKYLFSPLASGNYKVIFSLPANYIFTDENMTSDEADSDPSPTTGMTGTYTLIAGDSNMTVDAGIFLPIPEKATVGNYVWFDTDGNGTQGAIENGVSGITVTLLLAGVPVATTITDANGYYKFENVTPGTYSVSFTLPIGMVFTNQSGGVSNTDNSDADVLTGITGTFNVSAGDDITFVDAGIIPQPTGTCSLGDRVWNDAVINGIQDLTEGGVAGVTVTLYASNGITVLKTTTTDGLGNYNFTGLLAGCYVVGFSNLPVGYQLTTQGVGNANTNSDANVTTGKTNVVCLATGQNNPTIDAGIYNINNTNSIGDKVWYDVNKNGLQDATEYGYPGVVVTLLNATGSPIANTVTNANGNYLFSGLPNGTYSVQFGFVTGYQFTGANSDAAGILGANNSDANPSSGITAQVTLTGNTHITSVDAGIYVGSIRTATSSLGDIVWVDVNNNGMQDAGETGVPGVTVTLYEEDGVTVIATTVTDGLGKYIFTNLTDGEFVVGFSNIPVGYIFTTPSGVIDDE
jgi:hypothetical protein